MEQQERLSVGGSILRRGAERSSAEDGEELWGDFGDEGPEVCRQCPGRQLNQRRIDSFGGHPEVSALVGDSSGVIAPSADSADDEWDVSAETIIGSKPWIGNHDWPRTVHCVESSVCSAGKEVFASDRKRDRCFTARPDTHRRAEQTVLHG